MRSVNTLFNAGKVWLAALPAICTVQRLAVETVCSTYFSTVQCDSIHDMRGANVQTQAYPTRSYQLNYLGSSGGDKGLIDFSFFRSFFISLMGNRSTGGRTEFSCNES